MTEDKINDLSNLLNDNYEVIFENGQYFFKEISQKEKKRKTIKEFPEKIESPSKDSNIIVIRKKVGKSYKSKGWTLGNDVKSLYSDYIIQQIVSVQIDDLKLNDFDLNVTPRLFYSDSKIQKYLEDMANYIPEKVVEIKLHLENNNNMELDLEDLDVINLEKIVGKSYKSKGWTLGYKVNSLIKENKTITSVEIDGIKVKRFKLDYTVRLFYKDKEIQQYLKSVANKNLNGMITIKLLFKSANKLNKSNKHVEIIKAPISKFIKNHQNNTKSESKIHQTQQQLEDSNFIGSINEEKYKLISKNNLKEKNSDIKELFAIWLKNNADKNMQKFFGMDIEYKLSVIDKKYQTSFYHSLFSIDLHNVNEEINTIKSNLKNSRSVMNHSFENQVRSSRGISKKIVFYYIDFLKNRLFEKNFKKSKSEIKETISRKLNIENDLIKEEVEFNYNNLFEINEYEKTKITKPKAFKFKGKNHDLRFSKDLLMKLLAILTDEDNFERIFSLKGKNTLYFSKSKNDLRHPKLIEGTNIYAETNRSTNNIINFSHEILNLFGYTESDLELIYDDVNKEEKKIEPISYTRTSNENNFNAINSAESLKGWKKIIFEKIEGMNNDIFYLNDLYEYISEFQKIYPENKNIKEKIRQTLQQLKELGLIEFVSLGKYKKNFSSKKQNDNVSQVNNFILNEFLKYLLSISYENYKTWLGEDLKVKLKEIEDNYISSFNNNLFDINPENIEDEINLIKTNLINKLNVDNTSFAVYNILNNEIPQEIINCYLKFLNENINLYSSEAKNEKYFEDENKLNNSEKSFEIESEIKDTHNHTKTFSKHAPNSKLLAGKNMICPSCGGEDLIYVDKLAEVVCTECGDVFSEDLLDIDSFEALKSRHNSNKTSRINRNLKIALDELKEKSLILDLPKIVVYAAYMVFKSVLDNNLIKGKSMKTVVAVSLYVGSKQCFMPISLEEIADVFSLTKREIGRTYRSLNKELNFELPPISPLNYLKRLLNKLNFSTEVQSIAIRIIEEAIEKGISAGKEPNSVAATALYIASLYSNEKKRQKDIAEIAYVTEITIRKRYAELIEGLNISDILINDLNHETHLKDDSTNLNSWNKVIFEKIKAFDNEKSYLRDLYNYIPEFRAKLSKSGNIKEKIVETLQQLLDLDLIESNDLIYRLKFQNEDTESLLNKNDSDKCGEDEENFSENENRLNDVEKNLEKKLEIKSMDEKENKIKNTDKYISNDNYSNNKTSLKLNNFEKLVFEKIREFDRDIFYLRELYDFIPEFQEMNPEIKDINEKIVQTIQRLKELDLIKSNGLNYKIIQNFKEFAIDSIQTK
jgi:transcription initiation factor TFIIIB Brf1 subunit/transcription initiation factor TFIIB